MSYLTLPQLTFMGKVYCNPSTANNNDYAGIFDIDTLQISSTVRPIPGSTVTIPERQQTFNYSGPHDAPGLRTWVMGLMTGIESSDGGPFGQQAHWNYYGDSATRFDDTTVTGYKPARSVTIPSTDPLIGATVKILGNKFFNRVTDPVIVDVDPYALVTSQIFASELQVLAADGTTPLIIGTGVTRAFAYFIYVHKNVDPAAIGFQMVSAVFICSIPGGSGLQINPNHLTSPALNDLAQAVAAGAGLNMRYCFYDALYANSPQVMQQNFAAGNYIANPYLGKVLGTIGVLQSGDLQSAPMGRKLFVQNSFSYNLSAECGSQPVPGAPRRGSRPMVRTAPASPTASDPNASLGCTLAQVDAANRVVSLDLISTFPECNVKTNTKLNLGPMQLNLLCGGGLRVSIGSIPYDQRTYESGGGMVSISWAGNPQSAVIDQNIAVGTLTIFSQNLNQDLLLEIPGIDIQTDDRAIYFQDQGTDTIGIQVFEKDQPVQTPTAVNLEYWMCEKNVINPSKAQVPVTERYYTVANSKQLPNTIYGSGSSELSVITDQVTVPANANGQLTLTLTALRPGVSMIRFVDPQTAGKVAPNFAWDNAFYAVVRILPLDDYSLFTDEQINNWPFMYANVFGYFSLLYPIMSEVMPWGPNDAPNDPDQVKTFATQILALTDPQMWNSTVYMPITRELSAGKRALLVRWCNLNS